MASYTDLGNNKYKLFVELGYDDKGKRIRKTKTVTAKSPRALKKALSEFEIKVANSDGKLDVENISFAQFTDRWMDLYVRPELSIRTRDTYISYLNNGILKELGEYKLSKIKTLHIIEFFKKQKDEGAGSLAGKFLALKSIFSRAMDWETISKNPMDKIKQPESNTRERERWFYDIEQIKQLTKVLDDVYPKHRIAIKLGYLVGLRLAEIAGLQMNKINYNDNTILIDKTLQYDIETKSYYLAPTKSKKPRTVNVPSLFMPELREFVLEQKKLKVKCGNAWTPMLDKDGTEVDLLFTTPTGFPNRPNSTANTWAKIVKKYSLPKLNFHGLRHTYASYQVSIGTNFKIIQEQMGHSDIRETINRYSHLTPQDKTNAADAFNAILR